MKVKVGYLDYTVVGYAPRPADLDSLVGYCRAADATIGLRNNQLPAEQATTLIHELLHACFSTFNLARADLDEEDVCGSLDAPLATVFRDNPTLLGVLHQALCNGKAIVK